MNEIKKRQVHIWLDETDFIEYKIAAEQTTKTIGIDMTASKMIKVELQTQSAIKRRQRLGVKTAVVESQKKLTALEEMEMSDF